MIGKSDTITILAEHIQENRMAAAKLAEHLRDNTSDTDEMLLSVAEHAKELSQQYQIILDAVLELRELADTKADATALQNIAMLTSGQLEGLRVEIARFKQMAESTQASKAGLQLDVRNGNVVWKTGSDDWQNLIAIDRLRGPKGAPARGGGHTWRPSLDASGNLTWSESGDGLSPADANIRGPQGEQGDKGDQGIQGERGIQGEQGIQGIQGVQGIQGEPGLDGTDGLNGADGVAATVSVGSVVTGEPGTDAAVINSGTSNAAVLDFTIPRGVTGETGAMGATGEKGDKGDAGEGVPSGGTAGQFLTKASATDYDTQWSTPAYAPAESPVITGNPTLPYTTLFRRQNEASEGGQFYMEKPNTGSSLAGNVVLDIESNSLRIFESAGSYRGVTVNLAGCGSQSALWHSGNFNPSNYLPLAGGTVSGTITHNVAAGSSADILYGTMADNDFYRINAGGASNAGFLEIATADDGNEPIYVRQYSGVFTSLTRTATILDNSGNTSFPGALSAASISTASSGNIASGGAVTGIRLATGWDGGHTGSVMCNNWFRSAGDSGWYNESYGGGIYMSDSSWVRIYNGKSFYVPGNIETSGLSAGAGVTISNGTNLNFIAPPDSNDSGDIVFLNGSGSVMTRISSGQGTNVIYLNYAGYFYGNCSAASFTDRTPAYTGSNALAELLQIRDDGNGNIDHSTLPPFTRRKVKVQQQREIKDIESTPGLPQSVYERYETDEDGRDIGATLSMTIAALREVDERLKNLEAKAGVKQ